MNLQGLAEQSQFACNKPQALCRRSPEGQYADNAIPYRGSGLGRCAAGSGRRGARTKTAQKRLCHPTHGQAGVACDAVMLPDLCSPEVDRLLNLCDRVARLEDELLKLLQAVESSAMFLIEVNRPGCLSWT